MNLTGWRNDEKRVRTMAKQREAQLTMCNHQPGFRVVKLNQVHGKKISVEELAILCGVPYRDGKVG
jgi:copper oxidase (laccase) domain-containing protein